MNTALLAVFDSIENFLATISDALEFDILMWVFLGVFGFLVILSLIRLRFTYEVRAIKSFKKINKYFLKKPYINDSNLVEFNRLMKKIPYQLRDRWQYFMLNRKGLPSEEMTLYHCVEQPIKTSNYRSTIVMLKHITNICCVLCVVLSFFALGSNNVMTPIALVRGLIIPAMFFILCQLYIYFLNAKFNANSVDLYEYYLSFIRNLDKASASIPDYVDYELLFTDKEIRDGIPVLREYLEKRALLDKLAREKAKQAENEREEFDFRSLGIDGALLVERAMSTSQDYINSRNKLKDEITKLEAQKDKYNDQYITVEKDNQKKLQAVKENLARLQGQLESSANRIESNYIKKQQDQEKAKQAEIEKNLEDLNVKYAQQVKFLEDEISKRQQEIESDKKSVAEQMDAEFDTYNEKVYTILRNKIDQDDADALKVTRAELDATRDKLANTTQEKDNLALTLDVRQQEIDTLNSSIEALNDKIAKITSKDRRNIAKMYDENIQLKQRVEELEAQIQPAVEENVEETASDEVVYYDAEGNVVDFSQYYDENGKFKEFPKVYDADGNYYDFAEYYDEYGNPLNTEESGDDEDGEGVVPAQEVAEETSESEESVLDDESQDETATQQESVEENEIPQEEVAEMPQEEIAEEVVEEVAEPQEIEENVESEEPAVEEYSEESSEDVVYYDENGNVVDFEQYYDEEGRFKEFPKVYDADGNYYDFADYYDRDGNLLEQGVDEVSEEEIVPIEENEVEPIEEVQEVAEEQQVAQPSEEANAEVTPIVANVENAEEPKAEEIQEQPKRKRGRPRKVQSEDGEPAEKKPAKRQMTRIKDEKAEDKQKTAKKEKEEKTEEKPTAKKSTKKSTSKKSTTKKTSSKVEEKKEEPKKVETEKKTTSKKASTTKKASGNKKSSTSTTKKSAEEKSNKSTKKTEAKKNSKSNVKRAKPKTKKVDEDLDSIAGQIDSENAKLEQKQADLKDKITKTLSELNDKPTVDRDLEEIKDIIKNLKNQASEVNKAGNGLSEEEQKTINKQINKSLSELLMIMANKSKK